METGYYWIKNEGKTYVGFWNGEKWHHINGSHYHNDECSVIAPITFACQTGCACTTNPDGSITIHCT